MLQVDAGRPILPCIGSMEPGCCNVLCCGMLPQKYGCLAGRPLRVHSPRLIPPSRLAEPAFFALGAAAPKKRVFCAPRAVLTKTTALLCYAGCIVCGPWRPQKRHKPIPNKRHRGTETFFFEKKEKKQNGGTVAPLAAACPWPAAGGNGKALGHAFDAGAGNSRPRSGCSLSSLTAIPRRMHRISSDLRS